MRAIAYGTGFWSAFGHSVGGFPKFDGWPRWDSVTHQAMHEDSLKRAVDCGLRLMVMHAVNSQFLCETQTTPAAGRTCNDMDNVDVQLEAARSMEAYIDEKNGGPGQGWYRIVTEPSDARAVIEQGKLAVVLGIEVDYLFGSDVARDAAYVSRALDDYYDKGVRHLFPIHFSNNCFGSTAFQNILIKDSSAPLFSPLNPFETAIAPYSVLTEPGKDDGYKYRTGAKNALGLTDLGKYLIKGLISRGMIIDVDHMSAHSKSDTFDICEASDYPVVSGHSGFIGVSDNNKCHEGQLTDAEIDRIKGLGGMVAPILHQGGLDEIKDAGTALADVPHVCGDSTNSFAQAYLYAVSKMPGMPVGLGTDFNGFAGQPRPRFTDHGTYKTGSTQPPRLPYPFQVLATGASRDKDVLGERTFDINDDSVAHIGLLPDLIADLQTQGIGDNVLEPLLSSAIGYVELWEKAQAKADKALPAGTQATGSEILPGQLLALGTAVNSANGYFSFTYQPDGNLVLYGPDGAMWDAQTSGKQAGVCLMRPDGNLVIVRPGNRDVWTSETSGNPGATLKVQDDGNVVINRVDGTLAWATKTSGRLKMKVTLTPPMVPLNKPVTFTIEATDAVSGGSLKTVSAVLHNFTARQGNNGGTPVDMPVQGLGSPITVKATLHAGKSIITSGGTGSGPPTHPQIDFDIPPTIEILAPGYVHESFAIADP